MIKLSEEHIKTIMASEYEEAQLKDRLRKIKGKMIVARAYKMGLITDLDFSNLYHSIQINGVLTAPKFIVEKLKPAVASLDKEIA